MKIEKRYKIIDTAKDVLLKKGVFKTRVEDITNNLGIAKGSFYTYFKSKDILLEEIVLEILNARKEEYDHILENITNLEEGIEKFVENRLIIAPNDLKNHLILINLSKNLDSLGSGIREILVNIEILNRKTLNDILENFLKEEYDEEILDNMIIFIMGGVKAYRLKKFFFKNIEEFYISDTSEYWKKLENIDIRKDIDWLKNRILKFLVGGMN
ncbi:TetR/AcrR family transcriptional regulator [uncultured Cetobacterium sp.]|uniref:TetR/AcrR family transcriptional regulator n=1 Tax=uncultured Cetobacterium sp. TaxID=527638 RepID=UPI0026335978|nr:TetR/AcrR family transcriptional regulator [uncultured Cetobacterium sp.]